MTNEDKVASKIEAAFTKAREAGKDEDSIKLELIKAGSTFKSVNKDYAELLVKFGIVDSKEIRNVAVANAVSSGDVTTEEGFNAVVDTIIASVKGVDKQQAIMSLRAYCRKNEISAWVKPKGEGSTRAGFVKYFHEQLVANPRMTKEEADDIIHGRNGHPETSDNVKKHSAVHQKIRKLANLIMDVSVEDDDDEEDDSEE